MKINPILTEEKVIAIANEKFRFQYISLRVDDEWFNPGVLNDRSMKIKEEVKNRYWNIIGGLYRKEHAMVVRLSGLSFDVFDIKDYICTKGARENVILDYYNWRSAEGGHDNDSIALIECNKKTFKKLFDQFWFALSEEIRFEGIVIERDKVHELFKWSRRLENAKTRNDFIRMSSVYFDNQHNGFHYRVITKK